MDGYWILWDRAAAGLAEIESATRRFLEVNQCGAELMGWRQEELKHLESHSLTHPDDLPA